VHNENRSKDRRFVAGDQKRSQLNPNHRYYKMGFCVVTVSFPGPSTSCSKDKMAAQTGINTSGTRVRPLGRLWSRRLTECNVQKNETTIYSY
jgi:hypothetical protein